MRRRFICLAAMVAVLAARNATAAVDENLKPIPDRAGVNAPPAKAQVNVPGVRVDAGGGVDIAAPGVGVQVPPAGSRGNVGVVVPGAGVNVNANPNGRYRWSNNRWWYYHPGNYWSYWNNNRWNRYYARNYGYNDRYYRRPYVNRPRYSTGYRGISLPPPDARPLP